MSILKLAKIKTKLQPHQARALNKALSNNLLLDHSTGSGKTLTSIAVADAMNKPTVVLTPASLVTNFQKELKKHKVGGPPVSVLSLPTAAERNFQIPEGATLIVDEAHSLRNPGKRQSYVKDQVSRAGRVLALTGTPIYNDSQDLAAILNILSNNKAFPNGIGEYVRSGKVKAHWIDKLFKGMKDGEVKYLSNKDKLRKVLNEYVDSFYADIEKPERLDEVVKVPMSAEQLQVYEYITGKLPLSLREKIRKNVPPSKLEARQLNSFFSGARQVSNSVKSYTLESQSVSPKLQAAVDRLKETFRNNPEARALIYSNYLGSGIDSYAELLKDSGIKYNRFDGSMSKKEKQAVVDAYNSGKVPVILGSGSASEGLDLKNTRLIQLLEPHFNNSKLEQVIGRGIRYKSHDALPREQRNVTVQKFISTIPNSKNTAIDEYLMSRAAEKDDIVRQIKSLVVQ